MDSVTCHEEENGQVCGHVNPGGARLCASCGSKLGQKSAPPNNDSQCSSCGNVLSVGTKFCPNCGNRMTYTTTGEYIFYLYSAFTTVQCSNALYRL